MSQKGIRDYIKLWVPKWLSNRPGLNNGFKILYAMAFQADMLLELIIEAIGSWWPGYSLGATNQAVDASTAIPLIGLSRGLLQGEAETLTHYAARLPAWLDTWAEAGSAEELALQIQQYLANTPIVRIVDRAGNWVTANVDGTTTSIKAGSAAWTWNWDGTSNPERNLPGMPWWSDIWIIVYPCEWAVTAGTIGGGGLAAIWGNTALNVGIGHAVATTANDAIRSLAEQWKGAHTWLQAIIWSYDATLFDPETVNAGNPDGTWGDWGYAASPGGALQPSRNTSARYWIPPNG